MLKVRNLPVNRCLRFVSWTCCPALVAPMRLANCFFPAVFSSCSYDFVNSHSLSVAYSHRISYYQNPYVGYFDLSPICPVYFHRLQTLGLLQLFSSCVRASCYLLCWPEGRKTLNLQ